ncbi:hypothetical protein I547_7607, partial [Mycobacterium kansasii 824]
MRRYRCGTTISISAPAGTPYIDVAARQDHPAAPRQDSAGA